MKSSVLCSVKSGSRVLDGRTLIYVALPPSLQANRHILYWGPASILRRREYLTDEHTPFICGVEITSRVGRPTCSAPSVAPHASPILASIKYFETEGISL